MRCKALLEDHLGQKVSSFAYPHGYHSAAIKRLVREAGYTSACAVGYAMSSTTTDPFALARLPMGADTSLDALAALLAQPVPTDWNNDVQTFPDFGMAACPSLLGLSDPAATRKAGEWLEQNAFLDDYQMPERLERSNSFCMYPCM